MILSFDISTSCTGLSIIEPHLHFDPKVHLLKLDAISLPDVDFWQKCDFIKNELTNLKQEFPVITTIAVEEPLKRFVTGMSSIQTVITLQKFNAIVCLIARDLWKVDPTYINVSHARKVCGIKTLPTKKAGINAKAQVADWMLTHDLSFIDFPLKRGHEGENRTHKNVKSHVCDMIDSYVVAKGTMRL